MSSTGLPTSVALFAESLGAVARIKDFPSRANAHLAVVQSMHECGSAEAARKLSDDTLDLIFLVPDAREQFYLFRLLAVQQAKMQSFDDAANTFSFIPADSEQKGYAMREIGETMAAAGRIAQAVKIAERIEDLDDYEAVYKAITEYLVGRGRLDAAIQSAIRIEPSPLQISLLCFIAKERFRLGETAPALTLVRNTLPQARGFSNANYRNEALGTIAETFMILNRSLDARTALVEIDDPCQRTAALCQLGLFTFPSEPINAHSLLEDALVTAKKTMDAWKQARNLTRVAASFDEIGDREMGSRLFHEATRLIIGIRNPHQQASESLHLVEKLAESGRSEEARTVLTLAAETSEEVDELPLRLRLLGMIVGAQIDSLLLDDAGETIQILDSTISLKTRQNKEITHIGPPYSAPFAARLALARRDLDLLEEPALFTHLKSTVRGVRCFVDPLDRANAFRELAEVVARYEKNA